MTDDRASRVLLELDQALDVLTDEYNAGLAGPSGLRAMAIAHVRQARVLLQPRWVEIKPGVYLPRPEGVA
jgi:hypothetical protein